MGLWKGCWVGGSNDASLPTFVQLVSISLALERVIVGDSDWGFGHLQEAACH